MATSQPPLDPRKYPWRRGDLVTSAFKNGFVADVTPDYLDVLWMPEHTVERIDITAADNLVRLSRSHSVFGDGSRTNLESLEAIEALGRVQKAIEERIASLKSDAEKESVNKLIARAFAKNGCEWDRANSNRLMTLAIRPSEVGLLFKIQERLHRLSCKQHG